MKREDINELIYRFNRGELSKQEELQLEGLIESGQVQLDELQVVGDLQKKVDAIRVPVPSQDLDDRFYNMLALQKKSQRGFDWTTFFSWPSLAPKLAFASVTLLLGLIGGYLLRQPQEQNQDMQALTAQVSELKEMMMLSLLEKESATERLRAVSLTSEMTTASAKVTNALIETLNRDENVNVRLAALEALKPYARESVVREQLVRSIGRQTSPLVQVALADLMSQLQVKSSVKELEKIVESDRTPSEVKKRIQENIKVLI